MCTEAYNGWSNRWTWLVHLWLTNDPATYDTVRALVAGARRPEVDLENFVADLTWPGRTGLASDLVTSALAWVDWREVAAALGPDGPVEVPA